MTAKVSFKDQASLPDPRTPPPTFLFLLIFNCQITDQTIRSNSLKLKALKPQTRNQQKQSQSGNLEQKTSSPAAPPPSFSEGAYTAIPFSKSTHPNNVFSQFCNILIHNTDFKRVPTGRNTTPSADSGNAVRLPSLGRRALAKRTPWRPSQLGRRAQLIVVTSIPLRLQQPEACKEPAECRLSPAGVWLPRSDLLWTGPRCRKGPLSISDKQNRARPSAVLRLASDARLPAVAPLSLESIFLDGTALHLD